MPDDNGTPDSEKIKHVLYGVCLGLKLIVLYIIGYPLGSNISIESILLTSLILEVFLYLPLPPAVIGSFGLTVIVTLFQQPVYVSSVLNNSPQAISLIHFAFYNFFVIAAAGLLKKYRQQNKYKKHT